jgi:hypothetical protein
MTAAGAAAFPLLRWAALRYPVLWRCATLDARGDTEGTWKMNKKHLILAACIAWAAVAVSSASPANAMMLTNQVGNYATCATPYVTGAPPNCGDGRAWNYAQTIRLVSTTCSSSSCSATGSVWVESLYSVGRKVVSLEGECGYKYHVYAAGSCLC